MLGSPALAEEHLPPLGVAVGELAVVLGLRVQARRGRGFPVGEGEVVHAAAADHDQARVRRRLERGQRQGAQEVGAEEQVGGEGHLDALRGQRLLVHERPCVADQTVQTRRAGARLLRKFLPAAPHVGLEASVTHEDVDLLVAGLLHDGRPRRLRALPAAAEHEDLGPLARQELGDLLADAGVGARDQEHPLGEVQRLLQQVGLLVPALVRLPPRPREVLAAVEVELARGGDLPEHAHGCAACAACCRSRPQAGRGGARQGPAAAKQHALEPIKTTT
mmetsp:Transcript_67313/g.197625  ORF Transcript_67313/g.197625 Transcript_67313/m.197625 type:complete len:277 (-) Transcript_67313:2-832(-)